MEGREDLSEGWVKVYWTGLPEGGRLVAMGVDSQEQVLEVENSAVLGKIARDGNGFVCLLGQVWLL